MTAKHSPPNAHGLSKLSAAQFLIFLLALLCVAIVAQTYQSNNAAVEEEIAAPAHDRTQAQLQKNIAQWKASLAKQNIALACPYLNHDFVARIDLPDKRPVTLDEWSFPTEAKVAQDGYSSFVKARRTARVAAPESCIVHVFDSSGEEVAQASQGGVITSQYQPISNTEN